MHPVMVLVAFALAALVTYVLVLAALHATSALPDEGRVDVPDDPRDDPAAVPDVVAGTALRPWAPENDDRIVHDRHVVDVPAPDRRSHALR